MCMCEFSFRMHLQLKSVTSTITITKMWTLVAAVFLPSDHEVYEFHIQSKAALLTTTLVKDHAALVMTTFVKPRLNCDLKIVMESSRKRPPSL